MVKRRIPKSRTRQLTDSQRQRQAELRDLEQQGVLALAERGANELEYTITLKSSSDPVIARLLEINRQLEAVLAGNGLSHYFRVAVETAQFALTKAALLKGAVAVGDHDPARDHALLIALARVALTGRTPELPGLRAQVHDMLLRYARMADFSKLDAIKQRAVAELVAPALRAYAGTTRSVDTDVVAAALRYIVSRDGRPKGSRRNAAPTVPAAQEKWQALHGLYTKLGISGSTPEALQREIPDTKKDATMPRRLRQV